MAQVDANLVLGGGKFHLAFSSCQALIENGWCVMFARTSDLVQKLQVAPRELRRNGNQSARSVPSPDSRRPRLNQQDQVEASDLIELISVKGTGLPASQATNKATGLVSLRDNQPET